MSSGTASAEAPAKPGGTLRVVPQFEAATLLPVKAAALPEVQILSQILQGLYNLNPVNNQVQPLLAERWTSRPTCANGPSTCAAASSFPTVSF